MTHRYAENVQRSCHIAAPKSQPFVFLSAPHLSCSLSNFGFLNAYLVRFIRPYPNISLGKTLQSTERTRNEENESIQYPSISINLQYPSISSQYPISNIHHLQYPISTNIHQSPISNLQEFTIQYSTRDSSSGVTPRVGSRPA